MIEIDRIKELVELLNKAADAYYVNDNPIMTDKEYDKLYKKLSRKNEGTQLDYKIKEKLYQKGFKNH